MNRNDTECSRKKLQEVKYIAVNFPTRYPHCHQFFKEDINIVIF